MFEPKAVYVSRYRFLTFGFNWIAAIAGCAVVASAICHALPLPNVRVVYDKYRYFAPRRDQYDLLFVGSSRFFHHIDPLQFDAQIAKLGGPKLKSFNFGADAMYPPESFYVLRKILALRPTKLRWVVVELMEMHVKDSFNENIRRQAYWHDWRHTRLACAASVHAKFPVREKWNLVLAHVAHFVRTSLNLGRGAEWLGGRLARVKSNEPIVKRWMSTEGFAVLASRAMPPGEKGSYERAVSRSRRKMEPQPLRPVSRRAYEELMQEIHALGAEPIFVTTPTLLDTEDCVDTPPGTPFLAFNDPNTYPELFDVADRVDAGHLNGKGAARFTDLLAARIAERFMSRP